MNENLKWVVNMVITIGIGVLLGIAILHAF